MVIFGKNFSRCRYAVYLHGVPGQMVDPLCLAYVISSVVSVNEQKSQSDLENIVYDCTLTYGTCTSFGISYSFRIKIYGISYIPGTTNQSLNK